YPEPRRWQQSSAAPACPAFGADGTVERPAELAFSVEGVKPGRHAFEGYDVVWWDPSRLRLEAPQMVGLRQKELLGKKADPGLTAAQLERFHPGQSGRDAAIASGSRPSLTVQTATAYAAESTSEATAVELLELPRAAARPAGPRFGALVHAVLATAPLNASPDAIRRPAPRPTPLPRPAPPATPPPNHAVAPPPAP